MNTNQIQPSPVKQSARTVRVGIITSVIAVIWGFILAPANVWAQTTPEPDPALQQTVTESEDVAPQGETTVITHGHVDVAVKFVDNQWTFLARDDSGATPVWRELDDIVFVLGPAARQTLPESGYEFVGEKPGSRVWVVGQTEVAGTPWIGWSTQAPSTVSRVNGSVKLTFEGHQGEGFFTNFLQSGNFGAPQVLFTSAEAGAQTINVDVNTHAHTNWVFTQPGIHLIRLSAQATTKDGENVTAAKNLRFVVTEETDDLTVANLVAQAKVATWHSGAAGKGAEILGEPNPSERQTPEDHEPATTVRSGNQIWWWVAGGLGFFAALTGIGALGISHHSRRIQADAKGEMAV